MKSRCKHFLIILLLTSFFSGCDKDDDSNYIPQLPPVTQTGENTFGCLLDGELFIPSNFHNSTNCFYQLVDGQYYFTIRATNKENNVNKIIALKTEKKAITQGQTYNLYEQYIAGNAFATFFITGNSGFSSTSFTHTGELYISKLDFDNNIVSGTFWFDIMDTNGVLHQIREGRFDMQFTQ